MPTLPTLATLPQTQAPRLRTNHNNARPNARPNPRPPTPKKRREHEKSAKKIRCVLAVFTYCHIGNTVIIYAHLKIKDVASVNSAIKHTPHKAMQLRKSSKHLRIDGEHINTTQPQNVISDPKAKDYRQNNTALVIFWPIDESGKPEAFIDTRLIKFPTWQVRTSKLIAELYAKGIILNLVNWSIYGKCWFDKERTYNPPARMLYAWIDVPLPQNLRGLGNPSTW